MNKIPNTDNTSSLNCVHAVPAIRFTCANCDHVQYCDDNLMEEDYNNKLVLADVIKCDKCGEDNKVICDTVS